MEIISKELGYLKNKFELKIVNKSLGSGFDTSLLIKDFSNQEIKIVDRKQFIGTINTPSVNIEFDYEVLKPTSSILIEEWYNV